MTPALPLLLLGLTAAPEMARVGPGQAHSPYPVAGEVARTVPAFLLDRTPVTNAEFLAFVRSHPRWQRGAAPRLFADAGDRGRK